MYTQCSQCLAIFNVSMREVTVAKGKMQCGECGIVFDAMSSLSTTLPKPFIPEKESESDRDSINQETDISVDLPTDSVGEHQQPIITSDEKQRQIYQTPTIDNYEEKEALSLMNKLILAVLFLSTLLLSQLLFTYRDIFSDTPPRQPEKIKLITYNVFSHPNENKVLLVNGAIENHANQKQPYPFLELRLSDSRSNVIALRRFSPGEYIENYDTEKRLMPHSTLVKFRLKISDPGDNATHFQFRFL